MDRAGAVLGALKGLGMFGINGDYEPKQHTEYPNRKPSFTKEELAKLAVLGGKAKKQYLKELNKKYYGSQHVRNN